MSELFSLQPDICSQSLLGEGSQCYRGSKLLVSDLQQNCVVGDFSRVYHSSLATMVRLDRNNLIYHSQIGRLTYTGMNTVIMHAQIGQFCALSWGVTVGPGEHDYSKVTTHDFLYNPFYGLMPEYEQIPYNRFERPCTIGNDVWLGANVTVLRGCNIGNGAVIGANATVTTDIPPYAIAVGSPAKVIRYRFDTDSIARLQALNWWDLPLSDIRAHYQIFKDGNIKQVLSVLETL
ncbi:CatB-related O-acetyltransferase [Rheinheimera maricola]|uniref:CatB-related O-acetyltransferase n=1 Tax=Rheinheimera maricola TaxID=2793282 RepID=UPI0024731A4F|nr:CatB-related O-acetyltransferase [Rheinheimera maricola]